MAVARNRGSLTMSGTDELSPEKLQRATEAYLYGYPLVYEPKGTAAIVKGGGSLPLTSPYNRFARARSLLGPETKFVTPNNDTLHILAGCDLNAGPLVLHVPDTAERYYVLQFVDAWTNNFAYIGKRSTGTAEGTYLLAPADYRGTVPEGMTVVRAPTLVFTIVGRVQVNGADDLPAVRAVQDGFSLTPLAVHQGGSTPPPGAGIPVGDTRVSGDLRWWEQLRVCVAAFPPPPGDAAYLAILDELGVTARESPYVDPDPDLARLLAAAAKAGQELIEALIKSAAPPVNGWTDTMHLFDYNLDFFEVGTIDAPDWKIADRSKAYATRAAVARAGLWGNHGYEADYRLVYVDADGQQLDGSHRYELRLDRLPPVDAFWSLTMYDVPEFHLVENSIDRYLVGSNTPDLTFADDGSLTIYLQAAFPGAGKEPNWLPVPVGGFRPVMRLYQPGDEVLAGKYDLPPIRRVG
jgi:hypothetical protein